MRELFGSPLPVPERTRYDRLGVAPDASNDDLRWAKLEAVSRLDHERRALQERLDLVAADRQVDPDGDDPEVVELRGQIAERRQQAEEINGWNLDMPDARLAYDCDHPPLALLKLAPSADAALTEPRTCLFLLRSAIAEFLDAKGEAVFHPSDLTRRDFTDDFSFHELLDADREPPA
jgi:hypothetical protein